MLEYNIIFKSQRFKKTKVRDLMKFMKILTFIICLLAYGDVLTAIEIGDKAPPLNIAKWIKGTPVSLDSKNDAGKKACVIFFWATWNNVSQNLMNFISRESYIFKKDGVDFVGISKESPKRVTDFLKKYPDINFSIGIDNQAESYAAYMQGTKGVPMFFIIGPDKKLIWKGSPFEVNRVLVRALNGTFDTVMQEQIVKYREIIQKASQMLDTKEQIFYARKILKLDPADTMAMNIIIDNYIVMRKEEKAIDFISSSRKKATENKYIQRELFFSELGILRGMNTTFAKNKFVELAKNYSTVFNDDAEALNSLVFVVLQDVPFSIMPLAEILDISKKAVKLAEVDTHDKEKLSLCLQALARVQYYIGRLEEAISTQDKAMQLECNIKDAGKENVLLMLDYYKEALKLNKK